MTVEAGFSAFYVDADEYAGRWQAWHLRLTRAQLAMLIVAAVAANYGTAGLTVTAISFTIAITATVCRYVTKSDRRWWSGRAGAESAKTLCWRYCVGGAPFEAGRLDADILLASRLTDVAMSINENVPIGIGKAHITPAMREARAQSLDERRSAYLGERIRDQMTWYSSKASTNDQLGQAWSVFAIGCQCGGLVLAIVSIVKHWEFDFVGMFSAVAASAAAWLAVKQHDVLARSYNYASAELALIDTEISSRQWTEDQWAAYVDNAEEAISREHTAWRASRAT